MREVSAEIGVELVLLGGYTASAANDANTSVEATICRSASRIRPA